MTTDDLISSEWAAEDRLAVVNIISNEMARTRLPTVAQIRYWSDRLRFLTTATPGFLEANRRSIIFGEINTGQ